jgi:DNA-binding transcriptional LysR family regulator
VMKTSGTTLASRMLKLAGLHIPYGLYGPAGSDKPSPGDGTGLRVITMDLGFSEMPDAVWLKRLLPNATVAHRSNNREVQAQLCSHGAGLAVLPRPLGDVTPNIVAFELNEAPPGRDTFVGYHRDLRQLARMRELLSLIVERLA